jgi:hypothetical protein
MAHEYRYEASGAKDAERAAQIFGAVGAEFYFDVDEMTFYIHATTAQIEKIGKEL